MRKVSVNFKDANDVVKFVDVLSLADFDADLKCGGKIVDAKSLMGVIALSKGSNLELVLHTDRYQDILSKLDDMVNLQKIA